MGYDVSNRMLNLMIEEVPASETGLFNIINIDNGHFPTTTNIPIPTNVTKI